MVRKKSSDAVEMFEDNSIDFLFVDGNHEYEYVLEDLRNYYPKVKPGGIICGDDYFMSAKDNGRKMVQEAVEEFSNEYNLLVMTMGSHGGIDNPKNWLFYKPK